MDKKEPIISYVSLQLEQGSTLAYLNVYSQP